MRIKEKTQQIQQTQRTHSYKSFDQSATARLNRNNFGELRSSNSAAGEKRSLQTARELFPSSLDEIEHILANAGMTIQTSDKVDDMYWQTGNSTRSNQQETLAKMIAAFLMSNKKKNSVGGESESPPNFWQERLK